MGMPGGGSGKAQNSFVFSPASQGGGLSFWLEGKIMVPMVVLGGQRLSEGSAIQLGVL